MEFQLDKIFQFSEKFLTDSIISKKKIEIFIPPFPYFQWEFPIFFVIFGTPPWNGNAITPSDENFVQRVQTSSEKR